MNKRVFFALLFYVYKGEFMWYNININIKEVKTCRRK
nr:MAG TPA: hypothetical protein [Caudoviricetes sp.]